MIIDNIINFLLDKNEIQELYLDGKLIWKDQNIEILSANVI